MQLFPPAFPRLQTCKASAKLRSTGPSVVNKQAHKCSPARSGRSINEPHASRPSHAAAVGETRSSESRHSPVKAVAVLDEVVQLLAGVLDHVRVELHAVVHAKGTWGGGSRGRVGGVRGWG